jgi:NAD(P)-dependent dehydrogenase (short-subunit alcohol dehydrogenase family)
MKDFKNKVAVITGAASGIGRGLANQSVKEGMKVVLADIEKDPLFEAEEELKKTGAKVISVITDVSKEEDIKRLAQITLEEFGEVHILFNNAGVGTEGLIWEKTTADWEWVLNVNLWGVIHGIRVFTPIMLQQDRECYIVNTGSGFSLVHGSGIYGVTKRGILNLSEFLNIQLTRLKSKIKVAVIIPGIVNTNIINSERNRPSALHNDPNETSSELAERWEQMRVFTEQIFKDGMDPNHLARIVFYGIRKNKFYIIGDPAIKHLYNIRINRILRDIKHFENHLGEI